MSSSSELTLPIISEASAPGKLILCGEHAVVYGTTAVAGALSDLRVFSKAEINASGKLMVQLPVFDENTSSSSSSTSSTPSDTTPSSNVFEVSWTLDTLRKELKQALHNARRLVSDTTDPVIKPTEEIKQILEILTLPPYCTVSVYRKAIMPALFLGISIFADYFCNDDGEDSLVPLPGLLIAVTGSTLPIAAGLGSSAAVSVSQATCLLNIFSIWKNQNNQQGIKGERIQQYYSVPSSSSSSSVNLPSSSPSISLRPSSGVLSIINHWAYSSEMLFHGSPSGLDNTVATYGGALAYNRPPPSLIPPFTITSSTFQPALTSTLNPIENMPPLRILITNTFVPKETSKLVGGVRILRDTFPGILDGLLISIHGIAQQVLSILQDHTKHLNRIHQNTALTDEERLAELSQLNYVTYTKLGQCLKINQYLLNSIGVGHPVLDKVVTLSAAYGFTGKLTGAGGGGCAITLLPFTNSKDTKMDTKDETHIQIQKLITELKSYDYDCFETELGGVGVLLTR